MNLRIISILSAALLPFSAFGFGAEGHEAVAYIAQEHLTPAAKARITKIQGSADLVSIATWLDDVRSAGRNRGEMKGDPAAINFVHRFPGSPKWHFVNVAVGETFYDPSGPYASRNDVVHAIGQAVSTLEGQNTGLSQSEALRVLVHCVGDIHQVLHCVTGYYDLSDPDNPRLLLPNEVTAVSPEDAGGNALFYTNSEELHAFFDTVVLKRIAGTDFSALAAAVMRRYGAQHQMTAGDYHEWPTAWASESVALGTQAYAGIRFVSAEISRGQGHPALRLHKIHIELPEGYADREAPVMARQVVEAGLRLAELLNAISEPSHIIP